MKRRLEQLPPVSEELRTRARALRQSMTEAEAFLWSKIKGESLGVRFHRQRVIGRYICDFVSLEARLVLDVDGSQHFRETGQAKDKRRDLYLKSLEFRMLRFSNLDVVKNIEGVAAVIAGILEETPPNSPPYFVGGEIRPSPLRSRGELKGGYLMKRKFNQLPSVSPEMRQRARTLRHKPTLAERKLWQRLRMKQLGIFFHRQRVVGRYICDFVSLEGRLVVEVDGSQHYTEAGKKKDAARDEYLCSLEFRVLRFSDREVMNNIEGVLQVILEHLR